MKHLNAKYVQVVCCVVLESCENNNRTWHEKCVNCSKLTTTSVISKVPENANVNLVQINTGRHTNVPSY